MLLLMLLLCPRGKRCPLGLGFPSRWTYYDRLLVIAKREILVLWLKGFHADGCHPFAGGRVGIEGTQVPGASAFRFPNSA